MNAEESKIIQNKSHINYSYQTIKITKSRIDKGLIAIPRSLTHWFPQDNRKINIFFDNSDKPEIKIYSSFISSTRESRIGGLKEWFDKNKFNDGDEIVIQCIEKEKHIYRLISEKLFINQIKELQNKFDNSMSENDASEKILNLSKFVDYKEQKTAINEYFRMVKAPIIEIRKYVNRKSNKVRESATCSIRIILREIYQGICQVCGFNFLKRDNTPYFEIHHLDVLKGNHPQNLILVCANCHRQFEFANVYHTFNDQGWLVRVVFNINEFDVDQIILKEKPEEFIKQIHI